MLEDEQRRVPRRSKSTAASSTPDRRTARQRSGAEAEDLALRHLTAAGLRLMARNVRYKGGELDLVMRDGATLVFVEVRWRASAAYGGAAASIGAVKQRRLIHAAQCYLQNHCGNRLPPCRFDVVAVEGEGEPVWLRDAFGA